MKTPCGQINSGTLCVTPREGSEKACPDCNPRGVTITINTAGRVALERYRQVLATEKALTSDKEVMTFREELRGYASDFINACFPLIDAAEIGEKK